MANKIFLKEFNIAKVDKQIRGGEAIIYVMNNFIIKRITLRALANNQKELKRLLNLHLELKKYHHPYLAPIIDVKHKKDKNGEIEYIEILKKKYHLLTSDERESVKGLQKIVKEYFYKKSFLHLAKEYIITQPFEYQTNLDGIVDALLFVRKNKIDEYAYKNMFGDKIIDLHKYNVMKNDSGDWLLIDF